MKLLSLNTILVLFILSSCNQTRNDKEKTQSPDTQTDTIKKQTTKINYTDSAREFTEFIPEGHEILDLHRGDLNNDKREDVLLVLKAIDEEETSDVSNNPTPRPLLILIRQPDNSLQLARKNNKTVYCVNCGGVMGDPYMGLTIRNN